MLASGQVFLPFLVKKVIHNLFTQDIFCGFCAKNGSELFEA
jgi:hypothetical protein